MLEFWLHLQIPFSAFPFEGKLEIHLIFATKWDCQAGHQIGSCCTFSLA